MLVEQINCNWMISQSIVLIKYHHLRGVALISFYTYKACLLVVQDVQALYESKSALVCRVIWVIVLLDVKAAEWEKNTIERKSLCSMWRRGTVRTGISWSLRCRLL